MEEETAGALATGSAGTGRNGRNGARGGAGVQIRQGEARIGARCSGLTPARCRGKERPATVDLVKAAARRDLAQGLGAPAS